MKHFRALLCCCVLFCLVLPLSSCSEPYPFPNRDELVDRIELLYYPRGHIVEAESMDFRLIRELDPLEYKTFINDICALPTDYAKGDPPCDYGPFVARVTYTNGDVEYLGSYHIEFVEKGELPVEFGFYYFKGYSFQTIFFQYAIDAISSAE
ncbi:MAG: hypothetical protein IJF34_05530 [Clostridia bacterium]|nr:hypothetical protein [Clostridia bacterium]